MPLAEFTRRIVAIASKATGKTEDELRQLAVAMGEDFPKPTPPPLTREILLARGIPANHLDAVFSHPPFECEALSAVRRFLDESLTMLALSGSVGTCKTGSASWALTTRPGKFVKSSRLVSLAVSHEDEQRETYSWLFKCGLLVVDDVGGEYADDKGYFTGVLNDLVDERYGKQLRTIVTTNLEPDAFRSRYGERIADRFRQSGRWVNIAGKSIRASLRPGAA